MITSHEYIEKHVLVSNKDVVSLIKAEWQTIRTNQELIVEDEDAPKTLFSDACCGILFFGNHALASNGHWLLHTYTDGPSVDYNVSCFFYNYLTDEVIENYNPFKDEGVDIRTMLDMVFRPQTHQFKLRPVDIRDFTEQLVPAIRNRRSMAFKVLPRPGASILDISVASKKGDDIKDVIRVPVPVYSNFPSFSVNMSYIYKVMCLFPEEIESIYVESNGGNAPVYFKYPPVTVVLGQYFITKG